MKVTFYTHKQVPFYGINEKIRKIQSQIENKVPHLGNDTFTPSQSPEKTIIIENYYESENKKGDSGLLGESRNGSAAAEGAVSGVTTGSTIEGTKAVAQKIKNGKGDVNADSKESIDPDSDTPVNLLDQEEEINNSKDNDIDCSDSNPGLENDTELEINKPEIELDNGLEEVDIDPDIDPDIEPDIDTDIDIDTDFDVPELDIGDFDLDW